MPSYVYRCAKCELIAGDIVHGMREEPIIKCPDCNERMVKAVLPCNFQIRGFSHRNRRRQIEERYRKREQRDDWKAMSPKQKDWAASIAKKYGSSPWLHDPKADKGESKKKRKEAAEKSFQKAQEKQIKSIKGVRSAEFTGS